MTPKKTHRRAAAETSSTTTKPSLRIRAPERGRIPRSTYLAAMAAYAEKYRGPPATPDAIFEFIWKTCPGPCGLEKPIIDPLGRNDFGLKRDGGANVDPTPQGWCRACRNSKASHPTRYGL